MNGYSYILRNRPKHGRSRWSVGGTLCVLSVFVLCIPLAAGCPTGCICSGTTVDCASRDLTEVPSGIPTDTTFLYVFVCFGTSGPLRLVPVVSCVMIFAYQRSVRQPAGVTAWRVLVAHIVDNTVCGVTPCYSGGWWCNALYLAEYWPTTS